jgi:hypothetical protein
MAQLDEYTESAQERQSAASSAVILDSSLA